MKKNTKTTVVKGTMNLDKELRKRIHALLNSADDEMDRVELKGFITEDNMPRLEELNDSETVTVADVLLIGGYLALEKVHNIMHELDAERVSKQVDDMFAGKVEIEAILPDDMPKEVADLLKSIVDITKKSRKQRGE